MFAEYVMALELSMNPRPSTFESMNVRHGAMQYLHGAGRKPLHRWSWSAAQIQARRANSTRQILLRTSLSASVTPFRKGKIS